MSGDRPTPRPKALRIVAAESLVDHRQPDRIDRWWWPHDPARTAAVVSTEYVRADVADEMLEGLKLALHMMRNTNVPCDDGQGVIPAFDWEHPALQQIRAAIAKAEGDQ